MNSISKLCKTFILIAALPVLFSGCSTNQGASFANMMGTPITPVAPPPGFIVEFNQYPLYLEMEPKTDGVTSPSDIVMGEAEANYLRIWFGFLSFGWGDCSVEEAMADGKIKELHYADVDNLNILSLFRRTTVQAYGTR